jgi:OmpA-OmpF porin, OOP family
VALAVVAWTVLMPRTSAAQQKTFYLDRLYMAGQPDDGIAVWRPHMGDKTRFFGQFGLGFALNPFRIENHIDNERDAAEMAKVSGSPVSAQFLAYADIGVEIVDRFSFQVAFPAILAQGRNPTNAISIGSATDAVGAAVAAPGDVRLDARVILFRSATRAFKLGLNGIAWVPSGDDLSFAGDKTTSGGFMISAEYDIKKLFFVFNTGMQFRSLAAVNDFNLLHEWRWGFGAFLPLRDNQFRLGAQIFGSTGIGRSTTFDVDNTPLEWMLEGRMALGQKKRGYVGAGAGTRITPGYAPDFRLVALIGYHFPIKDTDPDSPGPKFKMNRYQEHGADTDKDGLPDDIDLCPTDPEDGKPPNPDDGCPQLPDRDGDGNPDTTDQCPDQPEDYDKVKDKDGCPEDDADKDNIGDAKDKCPEEPGVASNDPEKNGCPQFIRKITGSSEIQILKQVQFATGKATILPASYPILDEVVRLLQVNPEIKHLDIEGHTDNKGSDDLNEKLSDARSKSVMQYIISKGIDAGRLSAQGFGPRRPIADNNTAEGRQKNRRVEFHIKGASRAVQPTPEGGGPPSGAVIPTPQ